jgi:hypothetical protein
MLLKENDINSKLNISYAGSWISKILLNDHKNLDGLYFLKYARNCCDRTSPLRANQLHKDWVKVIFDKETKDHIDRLPEWKIENYCKDYLGKILL